MTGCLKSTEQFTLHFASEYVQTYLFSQVIWLFREQSSSAVWGWKGAPNTNPDASCRMWDAAPCALQPGARSLTFHILCLWSHIPTYCSWLKVLFCWSFLVAVTLVKWTIFTWKHFLFYKIVLQNSSLYIIVPSTFFFDFWGWNCWLF